MNFAVAQGSLPLKIDSWSPSKNVGVELLPRETVSTRAPAVLIAPRLFSVDRRLSSAHFESPLDPPWKVASR